MDTQGLAGRAAAQVEEFVAGAVQSALDDCPVRGPESALKV